MSIIFYCHKCGERNEFESKKDMHCDCGNYVKNHDNTRNHVNMRTTWSGTTQVEFSNTTMEEDIANRNKGNI